MGLTPLDDLFMAESLTAAVRRFADQSRERSFWNLYEQGDRIAPSTDTVRWDETRFSRDLATITGPDSPSKATKRVGLTVRTAPIVKITEHVDLPWRLMQMARGEGQLVADPAGMVNNALMNSTNRVMRTLNYWAAKSVLTANGQVDLGLFPNADIASGAVVCNYPVATQTALSSWALPGTKIRSTEINPLKLAYLQNTGFYPGVAIGSDALDGYLNANTEFSEFLRLGSAAARQAESSYVEGNGVRYGGIEWRFAHDYYAADATPDTEVDVISDQNLVAILPEQSRWRDTFALAEGIQGVPTGSIASVGTSGWGSLIAETRGWGSYIELITNPLGIRLHVFWCGMLIQKGVNHVMVFDLTP